MAGERLNAAPFYRTNEFTVLADILLLLVSYFAYSTFLVGPIMENV